MKYLLRALCCFLLCSPLVWAAKDSPSPLVKSLKGRVVFLRGMEAGDKLSFDAQGNFLGTGSPLPFSSSAVLIDKVQKSSTGLEVKAERVQLVFLLTKSISAKDFHYVRLDQPITIAFAIDPQAPDELDAAINKAFAFTAQEDLLGRPIPVVQKALATLGLIAQPGNVPDSGVPSKLHGNGASSVGPAVQVKRVVGAPRLIYSVPPARRPGAGRGFCVVALMVSKNGVPEDVQVVRSSNDALNQDAIDAVKQYRFLPSFHDGQPVPVQVTIFVNFR